MPKSARYIPLEEKIRTDIRRLVGQKLVPLSLLVSGDKLLEYSFETEWQEGGTTPVEKTRTIQVKRLGRMVNRQERYLDYEPSYKSQSLTKEQAQAVDKYLKSLLTGGQS